MTTLKIGKTNNFWIDNGIVGLYKVLESLKKRGVSNEKEEKANFEIALTESVLEIKLAIDCNDQSDSNNRIVKILNEARDVLSKEYTAISEKRYRWYFDEALGEFFLFKKTSYKTHLRKVFFNAKPEYEGILYLPGTIEKDIVNKLPKKKNMSQEIYSKFKAFEENNSDIFKKYIDPTERQEGFLNYPSRYTFGNQFEFSFLEKGKKICSFSGNNFKNTIEINGMYFPLVTGSTGEVNFTSFLGRKPQISSLYAFISLFSPWNLYFQIQNGLKNYFLLYDSNLKELNSFYNIIQPNMSQLRNTDYSNFETFITGTEYENETLFNFIISIYQQAKQRLTKDSRRQFYSKSIFTFTNDGNIFRDVKEYTSLTQLFELFDAFNETGEEKFSFNAFLNLLRFFQKRISSSPPKYDTTWRNRLCSDIFSFRSITKTIELFLGEVKLKEEAPKNIIYLDKILEVYNDTILVNMDKEMIKKCKTIGSSIGIYSQKEEDKSVLFSLRNAKSRIEFLKILSIIQFKISNSEKIEAQFKLKIYDDFFEGLPDTPQWEEYKSLVSIFAMNSFLYKPNNNTNS